MFVPKGRTEGLKARTARLRAEARAAEQAAQAKANADALEKVAQAK